MWMSYMTKFIFPAILFFLYSSNLQAENGNCSKSDFDFVKNILAENKLNKNNLSDQVFKTSGGQTCVIKNNLMLDGLSFTLYKLNDEKSEYIQVHNGLDGASKTYGPFVR